MTRSDCDYCGGVVKQSNGCINRARRAGLPLYCDKVCSGFARRKNKSRDQKKAEKKVYDQQYRATNIQTIKCKKAAHHRASYDPASASIVRKQRMPLHVEYCRAPQYKEYKRQYDLRYNMERTYGPFWEAARMLIEVEREVKSRATNYEIDIQNDTLNKTQRRKRAYGQAVNDQSRAQQHTYRRQS